MDSLEVNRALATLQYTNSNSYSDIPSCCLNVPKVDGYSVLIVIDLYLNCVAIFSCLKVCASSSILE